MESIPNGLKQEQMREMPQYKIKDNTQNLDILSFVYTKDIKKQTNMQNIIKKIIILTCFLYHQTIYNQL